MFQITHIQIRQLQWGYYCSNIAVICSNREIFFCKITEVITGKGTALKGNTAVTGTIYTVTTR